MTSQTEVAEAHSSAGGRRAEDGRVEELLLEIAECGDTKRVSRLQQEVVLLTLDLAEAVAHRYRGRGIDLDDLIQVGRMALVKAVRGYQPGRGGSFAAYAVPTISGEIKRYFRDCGWTVRPPRRLQELRADLAEQEARLQQELHRAPAVAEIAAAMNLTPSEVSEAQQTATAYSALSLDAPAPGSEAPMDLADTLSDPYAAVDTREALRHAVSQLGPRDRQILQLRFVEERTQSQIGEVLGVSQMQVSRLLASITARLRDQLTEVDAPEDAASPRAAALV